MYEFKIITVNDSSNKATVTLDSIIQFSGNSTESIKKVVKRNIERLIKNGLVYGFDISEDLNYSEMKFDEQSATLLMTLLPNSEKVMDFKENLVQEFFQAREIIKLQFMKIQELRELELNLKLKAKDNVIKQLASTSKDYMKITRKNTVYISANGLADKQDFTAKGFREFMKDLKLVEQKPRLTYYWIPTDEGLRSDLVIADDNNTPYFDYDTCLDLYLKHLDFTKEEV